MNYPERVLVTKIGFDGHDRGSRVVAAYLRDAGMEVIYTPPWQEIAAVVKLAMQEDPTPRHAATWPYHTSHDMMRRSWQFFFVF